MKFQRMTDAEIEAMKTRIEGEIKDLEEMNFTYQMWLADWRKRMAAQDRQRAEQQADAL